MKSLKDMSMKRINWITAILGTVLFTTPFVFGFCGNVDALTACMSLGVLIVGLGLLESYRLDAGMGLITFIAPFMLGFTGVTATLWSCLIVGALVAILDGYKGFTLKGVQLRAAQLWRV